MNLQAGTGDGVEPLAVVGLEPAVRTRELPVNKGDDSRFASPRPLIGGNDLIGNASQQERIVFGEKYPAGFLRTSAPRKKRETSCAGGSQFHEFPACKPRLVVHSSVNLKVM